MNPDPLTLEELQWQVHDLAREKGWWDGDNHNIPEKLALIHSEISEALEDYRKGVALNALSYEEADGKPTGFAVELADALIRILDLAGYLKIDMESVVKLKHKYNATRPYRHGGKRC